MKPRDDDKNLDTFSLETLRELVDYEFDVSLHCNMRVNRTLHIEDRHVEWDYFLINEKN